MNTIIETQGLPFDKVQACGNDFVLLTEPPDPSLIQVICDRNHGLGADGIMVFSEGNDPLVLDHYDSDGSRSFCLNGIRASLSCLSKKGAINTQGEIVSEGMQLRYEIVDTPRVFLEKRTYAPLTWRGVGRIIRGFNVDAGNPQFVVLADLDEVDFRKIAATIRSDHDAFPRGTNVNFLSPIRDGFRIITYERGVEGFTKACGSGMYAAALVLFGEGHGSPLKFYPEGNGNVTISINGALLQIEGTTRWVASGVWLCGC